jgi:hypothetical protein
MTLFSTMVSCHVPIFSFICIYLWINLFDGLQYKITCKLYIYAFAICSGLCIQMRNLVSICSAGFLMKRVGEVKVKDIALTQQMCNY